MMQPPAFLIGHHPRRGLLWAAIDPTARFPKSDICERRFGAYLAPFHDEDAARRALVAAGALHIEAEPGRKRRA